MEPLIFSPRTHRYSLALKRLPRQTGTIADIGGYKSRASIVKQYCPDAQYTSINPSGAWYKDELVDVMRSGVEVPLPNDSFEAVICVDTLEHVEQADRPRIIAEMCRLSRQHVVIVVPFAPTSGEPEEATLLKLTRGGGIDDMPSLNEHLRYGPPTLSELREYARQFGLGIEPATPRRTYWAGQWAMAINQLALGPSSEDVNIRLQEWQEAYLERCPSPSFDEAYRAVLWMGGA